MPVASPWSGSAVKATLLRPLPPEGAVPAAPVETVPAAEADPLPAATAERYPVSEAEPVAVASDRYPTAESSVAAPAELAKGDVAATYAANREQMTPELEKQLLAAYREQLKKGFSVPDIHSAWEGVKGVVSGVGQAGKAVLEAGKNAAENPTSLLTLAVKKNYGPTGVPLTEGERALEKNAAEALSGAEGAAGNTVALARSAARNVANSPTLDKLTEKFPVGTSTLSLTRAYLKGHVFGDPNTATDEQMLEHLKGDAAIKDTLAAAAKGEALPEWTGLDSASLAKDGVVLNPENIAGWQLALDPINLVPAAKGAFFVQAAGKTMATAATREAAESFLRKTIRLGDVAATTAGKNLGTVGEKLSSAGKLSAEYHVPDWTGITATTKVGGKIAIGLGKVAGAVGGGRAVNAFDALVGSPTVAGSAARLAVPAVEGTVHGAAASLPFVAGAENDEQAGQMVGAGAAFGAGGAAIGSVPGAAREASLQALRKRFETFDAAPIAGFDYKTDPTLDSLHDRQTKVLAQADPEAANRLNWLRAALKPTGKEIYLLPADKFAAQVSAHEQAAGRAGDTGTDAAGYVDGNRVYLSSNATALGHEVGHAIDALLPATDRADIRQSIRDTYTPEQRAAFAAHYDQALGSTRLGTDDNATVDEMTAEVLSKVINADQLGAVKPTVLKTVADAVGTGLEALGVRKPEVVTPGSSPTATPLGVEPSFSVSRRASKAVSGLGLPEDAASHIAGLEVKAQSEKAGLPTSIPAAPQAKPPVIVASPPASSTPAANPPPSGPAPVPPVQGAVPPVLPVDLTPKPNLRATPAQQGAFDKVATGLGIEEAANGLLRNPNYTKAHAAVFEAINKNLARNQGEVTPVNIDYQSVKTNGGGTDQKLRKQEQDAHYAAEAVGRLPDDARVLVDKMTVPYRWVTRTDAAGVANVNLLGMSLDKVVANADVLNKRVAGRKVATALPYAVTPEGDFTPDAARQFVSDLEVYTRNQANGYGGDGTRVTKPVDYQGMIPPENPTYKPVSLSKDKADYVNVVMGLAPPKTTKGSKNKSVVPNIEARKLAEANSRPVVPSKTAEAGKNVYTRSGMPIAETNPLRDRLQAAGVDTSEASLFKVTEELNLQDIKSVKPRPESGFRAPSTDLIRAGFMPQTPASSEPLTREQAMKDPTIFWHGSASGDTSKVPRGLHVGTLEAARQALNATIGTPVEGDWDGTRKYGETLVKGTKSFDQAKGQYASGYSGGRDSLAEDHFPTGKATFSNREPVPMDARPEIRAFRIVGDMTNTPDSPHTDAVANGLARRAASLGNGRRGFFYRNDGEDYGSISAVVPAATHVQPVKILTRDPRASFMPQPRKTSAELADERTSGLAFKNFFSDVTKGAEKYRPQHPWQSLLPLDGQDRFVREYDKHTGNFDAHIAASIPGFKDVQVRTGDAIVSQYPHGRVLDVGASEGSWAKTISALSGGKIETVSLDPNPDMAWFFNEKSNVPGASYSTDAFHQGFEDNGQTVKAFSTDKPFDVVHESMVFQFISPDREAQLAETKRLLKPDGVLLTEEKVLTAPEVWKANEQLKDKEYKNRYFTDEALKQKQAVVKFQQDPNEAKAVGMVDNMVPADKFEQLLKGQFKHVAQYWDSGNFKGYAASDDAGALNKLVGSIGDTQTKFSTVATPKPVEQSFMPRPRKTSDEPVPQHVVKPVRPDSVGDKDIRLVHFSGHGSDLDVLDPKKFGTAAATPGDRKGIAKTYYFVEGSKTGADEPLTARPAYGVRVHGGGIYDLTKNDDPLNWLGQMNRAKADQSLVQAGYTGLRVKSQGRDVVALFKPAAATPLGNDLVPQRRVRVPDDAPKFMPQPRQGSSERPADQSPATDKPAFYSRLNKTVEDSPQGKATGSQWKALIQNSKLGTSKGEYDLVGVGDLEDGKTYTKPEVLEYLKANQIQVKDVTLKANATGWRVRDSQVGENYPTEEAANTAREEWIDTLVGQHEYQAPDADNWKVEPDEETGKADVVRWVNGNRRVIKAGLLSEGKAEEFIEAAKDRRQAEQEHAREQAEQEVRISETESGSESTHFSSYQLPGGKEGSYREVLLTVPGQKSMEPTAWNIIRKSTGEHVTSYLSREQADKVAAKGDYRVEPSYEQGWKDGHSQYSEIANPVTRLRYNERATADGKKMLFLEEVQAPQKDQFEKMPKLFQDKWRDIGFKWALRKAVEQGADALGWTTGDQQVERYDLSKKVGRIVVQDVPEGALKGQLALSAFDGHTGERVLDKLVSPEELDTYVGKELADKLNAQEWQSVKYETPDGQEVAQRTKMLTGDELQLGGEGIKRLYDSDFRNVVNGLPAVKKSGEKVGISSIAAAKGPERAFATKKEALTWADKNLGDHEFEVHLRGGSRYGIYDKYLHEYAATRSNTPVHSLNITPALREAVMGGQAQFMPKKKAALAASTKQPHTEGPFSVRPKATAARNDDKKD